MKIGAVSVAISPGPEHDAAVIDGVIERALIADRGGFRTCYFSAHHFNDYAPYADNMMLAAYLAPQFKKARLGLCVATVPYYHPALLAERATLLSQLTKGNFVFGVGSGGVGIESYGLGFNPDDRGEEFDQNMDALEKLWRKKPDDPPLEFKTPNYHGKVVQRLMPAPYQGVLPPIVLACIRPGRLKYAAERAWSVIVPAPFAKNYHEELKTAGHDEATVARCLEYSSVFASSLHCADTDERARAEMKESMTTRLAWTNAQFEIERVHGMANKTVSVTPPPYTADEFLDNWTIWGGPDRVFAKLKELAALGFPEVMFETDQGVHHAERIANTKRSYQLLADEVVPRLEQVSSKLGEAQQPVGGMGAQAWAFGKH